MLLDRIRKNKGKSLLTAGIVLMWVSLGIMFKTYGYEETWHFWHVPADSPSFIDLRTLTGGAESFRAGYEPTLNNPFDPYGRPFNYAYIWRLLFFTGISQEDTVWMGTIMIVLFFISIISFPENPGTLEVISILVLVFSPALMLLYERGNIDMLVFSLCVLFVFLENSSSILSAAIFLFAIALKTYPVFGVLVYLNHEMKKVFKLSGLVLAASVVYFGLTLESIKSSWINTQYGDQVSYGAKVFTSRYGLWMVDILSRWFSTAQASDIVSWLPYGMMMILIGIAVYYVATGKRNAVFMSERRSALFRMSASIYLGTFLLGNNWDYRLSFLILAVPQLWQWINEKNDGTGGKFAVLTLGMILISCWHILIWFSPMDINSRRVWFLVDELFNWILVFCFSYFLFASAPDWARRFMFRSDSNLNTA